jgi:hypothetical protein
VISPHEDSTDRQFRPGQYAYACDGMRTRLGMSRFGLAAAGVDESLVIIRYWGQNYRFDSASLAWGAGELVVQGTVPAAVETGGGIVDGRRDG